MAVGLLWLGVVAADEGMWLPEQLPKLEPELHEAGLAIDPSRLADLTGDPMGAIVSLGGCSASFVSPEGLVVTNHHCAFGSLQFNSTEDHNLLRDGFLAENLSAELPAAPGSRVYVTLAVEDVTDRIRSAIPPQADGPTRHDAVESAEKQLVAGCETAGRHCRVASFDGGVRYRLYTQLELRDIRLVYAPAGAIGKFGGDIDNWMWPRHTGDFSFLRAYVAPDGTPADPSPDNVPYRPAHWLEVSTSGVAKGDFVMVAGFPGRTDRYRLADEVEEAIEWTYPQKIERLRRSLEIIARETADRPKAAIAYAAWVSYINNSLKNAEGMLAGFSHSGSVPRKRQIESELTDWVNGDPDRKARWGNALSNLRALHAEGRAHRARDQTLSSIARSQLLSAATTAYRLARERELEDAARTPGYQERDLLKIRAKIARMDRSFDPRVDRALLEDSLRTYAALPSSERLPSMDTWFGIVDGEAATAAISATLDAMYAATTLDDTKARLRLLEVDRATLEASADPFLRYAVALHDTDRRLEDEENARAGRSMAARPPVAEAMNAFFEATGEVAYPDANGTLRVTYGQVKGYSPRDAVVYRPFTTVSGILEKTTGKPPFDTPPELVAAIEKADWGPYTSKELGTLPVNFLSSVDTTGGNSGSATLDNKGRLVGLLFDGNWESMIADWDFLPAVTRSIHVDVRYMLWVMDRVDHAWNLLEEMGIVLPGGTPDDA
jgi:hypothetical protein